jgi:hypothetical protein
VSRGFTFNTRARVAVFQPLFRFRDAFFEAFLTDFREAFFDPFRAFISDPSAVAVGVRWEAGRAV